MADMRALSAALATAFLALAVPAHAADLATIGCVADKLTPEVGEKLSADIERNLRESGKKHSYDPAVTQGLKDAATACSTENGWPQTALRPAMLYTIARAARPIADKVATERGLDPAVLEEVWGKLPEETRNRPVTPEVNRTLSEATAGQGDQSPGSAELVGEFFGFLSMMQYCSYDFSQA